MISIRYFARPGSSILASLISVIAFTLTTETAVAQPGRGPAAVAVGKVVQVRRAGSETFVGTLQPTRRSVVGSAIDGRVIMMEVRPGDPVSLSSGAPDEVSNSGDGTIMQLRTGTLEIEIGAAEIQLKIAIQARNELATSLPKEIEFAAATFAESQARLKYAQANSERASRLSGSTGAISQGELELARSQFMTEQESVKAARIDFERLKLTRDLRLLQSDLRVESAQQELKRLHDLKAKYTIRAPFDGVITRTMTDVGEWVTQGQPVAEVVSLNPIEMVVNIPQAQLQRLQSSLQAGSAEKPMTAKILIDGLGDPLTGIVKRIVSQADLLSRTFPVRIEIENPAVGSNFALQPGMLGRATMNVGGMQTMMMVHKDALVLSGDKASLFKIVKQGEGTTVESVPVSHGDTFDDWIQVTGKISTNDQVVVLGNERLKPGQEVRIAQSVDDVPE